MLGMSASRAVWHDLRRRLNTNLPMNLESSQRPVILIILNGYIPGFKFGGPIRAIENLVHHLGDEFDFRIITRDHYHPVKAC